MVDDDIQDADGVEEPVVVETDDEINEASPRRRAFVILACVAVLFLVIVGYVIWNRNAATTEPAEEGVVSVKVAKVQEYLSAKRVTSVVNVILRKRGDLVASTSAEIRQWGKLKNGLVKRVDPI